MKKCLSCVQTAPSLTVMRTQKMRNGSFSFFFSFTHESPENTGHTLQYVNPLLVEDKDIHHILVITAVLFCTFTPDELQQPQKSFFFFFLSFKLEKILTVLCPAEEPRRGPNTRSGEERRDAHSISAKEREKERVRVKERERKRQRTDKRTDAQSANCERWNVWPLPFSSLRVTMKGRFCLCSTKRNKFLIFV